MSSRIKNWNLYLKGTIIGSKVLSTFALLKIPASISFFFFFFGSWGEAFEAKEPVLRTVVFLQQ